jgi:hypothetical protein
MLLLLLRKGVGHVMLQMFWLVVGVANRTVVVVPGAAAVAVPAG